MGMQQTRENIIGQAKAFFLQYGFRNVTMDELCRGLGISKKTLYQCFDTKDLLVEAVISDYLDKEIVRVRGILEGLDHPVDVFFHLSRRALESLKEVSPMIVFDLQRNHPEIWKQFVQRDFMWQHDMLTENVRDGIKQGFYREAIDADKVIRLFLLQSVGMLRPRIIEPEIMDLLEAMTLRDELFLRSICTPLGLERLATLLSGPQRNLIPKL